MFQQSKSHAVINLQCNFSNKHSGNVSDLHGSRLRMVHQFSFKQVSTQTETLSIKIKLNRKLNSNVNGRMKYKSTDEQR